jgi:predicted YcjX-like family ATPase
MDSTISIKKVTHNNREFPAIKFNPDEDIPMSFVQEAVFALIGTAVNGLSEKGKTVFLSSLKENVLNIFDKPEEELLEFWDKCGYKKI